MHIERNKKAQDMDLTNFDYKELFKVVDEDTGELMDALMTLGIPHKSSGITSKALNGRQKEVIVHGTSAKDFIDLVLSDSFTLVLKEQSNEYFYLIISSAELKVRKDFKEVICITSDVEGNTEYMKKKIEKYICTYLKSSNYNNRNENKNYIDLIKEVISCGKENMVINSGGFNRLRFTHYTPNPDMDNMQGKLGDFVILNRNPYNNTYYTKHGNEQDDKEIELETRPFDMKEEKDILRIKDLL